MSRRIIIHGGAGAMQSMGSEAEQAYRRGLRQAIDRGWEILEAGGNARQAVVIAVREMERSGAFNAGRGSALSFSGRIEADAAVMDGRDLAVGGVAAVPMVTNAVELAEVVLQKSPHCLLAGEGARQWGMANFENLETFPTPDARLKQWRRMRDETETVDSDTDLSALGGTHDLGDTVGALALDEYGQLACAVSTGGIWLKTDGRVGDSPLVGSGLWADSTSGAVCATGTGEFIIRSNLVSRISFELESGRSAEESCRRGLAWLEQRFGWGKAGVISIDSAGRMAAPFDTAGMGRAWMTDELAEPIVAVWPDEAMP